MSRNGHVSPSSGLNRVNLTLHNLFLCALLLCPSLTWADSTISECSTHKCHNFDVVVYGSTLAGIAAAIQTVRMNKTVAIVTPDKHLGGLTSSGLGWTDSKDGNTIGGIARQFYGKIYQHYLADSAWTQETRSQYLAKRIVTQPGPAIDDAKKVQWTFEPQVAEKILERWMKDAKVPIYRGHRIARTKSGVVKEGSKIRLINTEAGGYFTGSMFIDASYEGDFMATAGIPYVVGRESKSDYGEPLAGIRIDRSDKSYGNIDPYVTKGQPSSGLLPGIQRVVNPDEEENGTADPNRLQSYNFRLPLTKNPGLKKAFTKPASYDEKQYELLLRYIENGNHGAFFNGKLMPNGKTDTNAEGKVSTDLLGGNYDNNTNYAEDSYEKRDAITRKHETYTKGFFWTLANHNRVPKEIRDRTSQWGYANDEFTSNANWPYSIYIREARRMKGVFTMTQKQVQYPEKLPGISVVGLGSYTLDSHQVERVIIDGHIFDEGLVHVPNQKSFPIHFTSIIPKAQDATNFLNPVTLSSSHVAYASIRMEPTYMILGQSAATAAVMAIDSKVTVQNVNQGDLYHRLKKDGQVLSF